MNIVKFSLSKKHIKTIQIRIHGGGKLNKFSKISKIPTRSLLIQTFQVLVK